MAIIEAGKSIGLYEVDVESYRLVPDVDHDTQSGTLVGDMRRVLGIGDDFGGEHQRSLASHHGKNVTISLSAESHGKLYSLQFKPSESLRRMQRHILNVAIDYVQEDGQPDRMEMHCFEDGEIVDEGIPLPVSEETTNFAKSIIARSLTQQAEDRVEIYSDTQLPQSTIFN